MSTPFYDAALLIIGFLALVTFVINRIIITYYTLQAGVTGGGRSLPSDPSFATQQNENENSMFDEDFA